VAKPIFISDDRLRIEILKILLRATLVSRDYPGQKCYKLTGGPNSGKLIPVVRADSTLIVGSRPDESPAQFPCGTGLRGVMAQRRQKMTPDKLFVQETLHELGFTTIPLAAKSDSLLQRGLSPSSPQDLSLRDGLLKNRGVA
jgi:hypothetical protein